MGAKAGWQSPPADARDGSSLKAQLRLTWCAVIIAASMAASSCRDSAIIWSGQSKSPDGTWDVTAQTEQFGGMGTAVVITTVYIGQHGNNRAPLEILELWNGSAYPAGVTQVQMNWVSPAHLEVVYQKATVNFQAVRLAGVTITVREASGQAPAETR